MGEVISIIHAYSQCSLAQKRSFWDELQEIKGKVDDGIQCILVDFNAIRKLEEGVGVWVRVNKEGVLLVCESILIMIPLYCICIFPLDV